MGVQLLLNANVEPSTWTLTLAISHCQCDKGEQILRKLIDRSYPIEFLYRALLCSAIREGNTRALRVILRRAKCKIDHELICLSLSKRSTDCTKMIAGFATPAVIGTAVMMHVIKADPTVRASEYSDCKRELPSFVADFAPQGTLAAAIERCHEIVRDLKTRTLQVLRNKSVVADREYRTRHRLHIYSWRKLARGRSPFAIV